MEFERLNLFQAKQGFDFKQIWSNKRPEWVKNYKAWKFMKAAFFQYTFICRGDEYIRTQADFINMNPEEIFFIARVLLLKSEKASQDENHLWKGVWISQGPGVWLWKNWCRNPPSPRQ